MALSQAQRKANDKYIAAHYERLPISYPIDFCDLVRAAAAADGQSLAGYIRSALDAYMAQPHAPALPPVERPRPAKKEAAQEHPAPRKRGRPRKNPAPLALDTSGENAPASVEPERPATNMPAENAPALEATEQVQPAQLE